MSRVPRDPTARTQAEIVLEGETSLLDIVDHVLTKGVVVNGDLVLGVADVDLVYLRLSAVLCAADRILAPRPPSSPAKPREGSSRVRGSVARRLRGTAAGRGK